MHAEPFSLNGADASYAAIYVCVRAFIKRPLLALSLSAACLPLPPWLLTMLALQWDNRKLRYAAFNIRQTPVIILMCTCHCGICLINKNSAPLYSVCGLWVVSGAGDAAAADAGVVGVVDVAAFALGSL